VDLYAEIFFYVKEILDSSSVIFAVPMLHSPAHAQLYVYKINALIKPNKENCVPVCGGNSTSVQQVVAGLT